MFYYMLFNHYQSTTEEYNILITTFILYWLCFFNVPDRYRHYTILGLILIDLYFYLTRNPGQMAKPGRMAKPGQMAKPGRKKGRKNRRVRFAPEVEYRYIPAVKKQEEFFPNYMTYGRKPEVKAFSQAPLIDNRAEYEDIISQDNNSVLSSFASSFADSDSSNSY